MTVADRDDIAGREDCNSYGGGNSRSSSSSCDGGKRTPPEIHRVRDLPLNVTRSSASRSTNHESISISNDSRHAMRDVNTKCRVTSQRPVGGQLTSCRFDVSRFAYTCRPARVLYNGARPPATWVRACSHRISAERNTWKPLYEATSAGKFQTVGAAFGVIWRVTFNSNGHVLKFYNFRSGPVKKLVTV